MYIAINSKKSNLTFPIMFTSMPGWASKISTISELPEEDATMRAESPFCRNTMKTMHSDITITLRRSKCKQYLILQIHVNARASQYQFHNVYVALLRCANKSCRTFILSCNLCINNVYNLCNASYMI